MVLLAKWLKNSPLTSEVAVRFSARDSQCNVNIAYDMSANQRSAKSRIFSPSISISSIP